MVASLVFGGAVVAAPDGAPALGSRLEVHGWSSDSRFIAYTRVRVRPDTRRRRAPPIRSEQRMHREVRDGAFGAFGSHVGRDVFGLALAEEYVAEAAPRVEHGRTGWRFTVGSRTFSLDLRVGDGLGWSLSLGDDVLAQHDFSQIYIAIEPALYPSPNGAQAVLVMHLDTGWLVDAAIYPVSLVPWRPPEAKGAADDGVATAD